jgi:hypothetical protein
VVESQVSASLEQSLPAAPHALVDVVATGNVDAAVAGAPPGLEDQVALAAETAFVAGFDEIQLVSAAIAFAGAILALVLVRQRDFVAVPGGEAAPAPAAG